MDCKEASVLLHALIDGEVDAGHAREIENHIAKCPACAAQLREFQEFRKIMAPHALRHTHVICTGKERVRYVSSAA